MKTCKQIMKALAQNNHVNQASRSELAKVITVLRGGDPRTVVNWLRVLEMLGYIERFHGQVFKLHFERCGEALAIVVRSGQKKLL